MIAQTYTTNSSANTITKTITSVSSIDLKFKEVVDVFKPDILIKYADLIDFNYVYIEKFSRYYFVEGVEAYPNKIFRLSLRCDVLMSFKTDILASSANIIAQTEINPFYNSNYSSEMRKQVDLYYTNKTFTFEKTMILCTIGGV